MEGQSEQQGNRKCHECSVHELHRYPESEIRRSDIEIMPHRLMGNVEDRATKSEGKAGDPELANEDVRSDRQGGDCEQIDQKPLDIAVHMSEPFNEKTE